MENALRTTCCFALLLSHVASSAAAETDDPERTAAQLITPETEHAVEDGLRWLADRQHDDGSFGSANYRGNVAVTGLCGLAFMAGVSTPGRGPYGAEVGRCVDYLLAKTEPSGYVIARGSESYGPMYGHGFATLFLAECYGMSKRPILREKLQAAIELIVNSQNAEGGWRYYPERVEDADISVTICQVMALRAARNAGLFVPKETIDRCVGYVKKSQNADGGFMYMLSGQRGSEFPRSGAGVVALYSAGIYEGPEIVNSLEYLSQFRPEKGEVRRDSSYYYYGHYYAVQAMWHAGGEHWHRWFPAIRDDLIDRQQDGGFWISKNICPEYATAMACIVLQIPENCLPIFQR